MNGLYIVVINNLGRASQTQFSTFEFERQVLDFITNEQDEQLSVERVFKVDVWGNVKHYRLALDGFKLKLEQTEK